jgi:hypothetical protein
MALVIDEVKRAYKLQVPKTANTRSPKRASAGLSMGSAAEPPPQWMRSRRIGVNTTTRTEGANQDSLGWSAAEAQD